MKKKTAEVQLLAAGIEGDLRHINGHFVDRAVGLEPDVLGEGQRLPRVQPRFTRIVQIFMADIAAFTKGERFVFIGAKVIAKLVEPELAPGDAGEYLPVRPFATGSNACINACDRCHTPPSSPVPVWSSTLAGATSRRAAGTPPRTAARHRRPVAPHIGSDHSALRGRRAQKRHSPPTAR